MKSKKNRQDNTGEEFLPRLRGELTRAAAGESVTPRAVIEATDAQLLRILRRGTDDERRGLIGLLESVGARGRKVAEMALASEGLKDHVALALLTLLSTLRPDNPLSTGFHGIGKSLGDNRAQLAREQLEALPLPLAETWSRCEGAALLAQPSAALGELLRASELAATLLLATLSRDTTGATIQFLASVATDAPRAVRRAIRAAFFRLRQLGVATPELESTDTAVATPVATPPTLAWVSAIDAYGDQAVWVIEPLEEGGTSTLQAIIDEDGLLRTVDLMVVSRRDAGQIEQTLRRGDANDRAAIAPEDAIGLVEEAYARSPTTVHKDYQLWRRLVQADRRGRRWRVPTTAVDTRTQRVRRSAELLEHEACAQWLLDFSVAERAFERLCAAKSPLVLSPSEEARRSDAVMQTLVEEIFTPLLRRRCGRRLTGTAIFMTASGAHELAEIASATCEHLIQPNWQEIPLLSALIDHSVKALLEARRRETEKEAAKSQIERV